MSDADNQVGGTGEPFSKKDQGDESKQIADKEGQAKQKVEDGDAKQ